MNWFRIIKLSALRVIGYWLALDGELTPVMNSETHRDVARKMGLDPIHMLRDGYMRLVTGYGNLAIDTRKPPTHKQHQVLSVLAQNGAEIWLDYKRKDSVPVARVYPLSMSELMREFRGNNTEPVTEENELAEAKSSNLYVGGPISREIGITKINA